MANPLGGDSVIGIMQGRLLPPEAGHIQRFPRDRWEEEFAFAAESGVDSIEWVYDQYGKDVNPLATDPGLERIRHLAARYGIAVRSACADDCMETPLVGSDRRAADEWRMNVEWLIGRAAALPLARLVLPFVDEARLRTAADRDLVVETLLAILPTAERDGVELHLETDLSPPLFGDLLQRLRHPLVLVNYDSGNSASLGFDPIEELETYGDRLGSVHIKDRVRCGGTVPLGAGDADFNALFEGLRAVSYSGDFILQVARGDPGDEIDWARQNRSFVEKLLAT